MDYCIPQQMYSSTNSTINSCSQSQFLVNSTIKGTKWIYDTKNFHKTVVSEVTKTCKYFLVLILFFSGILYVIKVGKFLYLNRVSWLESSWEPFLREFLLTGELRTSKNLLKSEKAHLICIIFCRFGRKSIFYFTPIIALLSNVAASHN